MTYFYFYRSQSDCDCANSPSLGELNIDTSFATSVLVFARSTHSFNKRQTENTPVHSHV